MPWAPGEALLIRIWETIERLGIGVMSPAQIRREGRARADVRREEALVDVQTRVEVEAMLLNAGTIASPILTQPDNLPLVSATRSDPAARSEPRLISLLPTSSSELADLATIRRRVDDVERLLNVRAIHRAVEKEAIENQNHPLPEDRPSDAWLMAWREGAEIIDEEYLQGLWARLLCNELVAPGTYTRRTLEALKSMSEREAKLFNALGPYVLNNSILLIKNTQGFMLPIGEVPDMDISFDELLELQDAGLISDITGMLSLTLSTVQQDDGTHRFFIPTLSDWFLMLVTTSQMSIDVGMMRVSRIGTQVLRLGRFELNSNYLNLLISHVRDRLSPGASLLSASMIRTSAGQDRRIITLEERHLPIDLATFDNKQAAAEQPSNG